MMLNDSNQKWSEPQAPIWCLVAGYESKIRAVKPLVFLQSYADDSSSNDGDQRLFMAGFVGLAENWAAFSDDWHFALKHIGPPIEYLRMVEAQNRRDQFRNWSIKDRDAKIRILADVIKSYPFLSFDFSVSRKAFTIHVKPHAPRALAKPHFSANFLTVSGISRFFQNESGAKIEFIFDEQDGVDADVYLFFEYMCRNIPKDARDKISGFPIFKNDKELLPLQAADMAAWFVRRAYQLGEDSLPIPLYSVINEDQHLKSEIPDETLVRWGEQFATAPVFKDFQSKAQWRNFRKEMSELIASGFIPPHGTDFDNVVHDLKKRLARFIGRE